MAKLYIREYTRLPHDDRGQSVPAGDEPGYDQTPVDFSGGVASSAAFAPSTRFVRLHTDAICSFAVGAVGVSATTSNARMVAGQTESFGVTSNSAANPLQISVISNT